MFHGHSVHFRKWKVLESEYFWAQALLITISMIWSKQLTFLFLGVLVYKMGKCVYLPILLIKLLWGFNEIRLRHSFENCNTRYWYGFGNIFSVCTCQICMCHWFLAFYSKDLLWKSKGTILPRAIEGQRVDLTWIIMTTAIVTLTSWRSVIYFVGTVYAISASLVHFTWNEYPSLLSPGFLLFTLLERLYGSHFQQRNIRLRENQ